MVQSRAQRPGRVRSAELRGGPDPPVRKLHLSRSFQTPEPRLSVASAASGGYCGSGLPGLAQKVEIWVEGRGLGLEHLQDVIHPPAG